MCTFLGGHPLYVGVIVSTSESCVIKFADACNTLSTVPATPWTVKSLITTLFLVTYADPCPFPSHYKRGLKQKLIAIIVSSWPKSCKDVSCYHHIELHRDGSSLIQALL